MSINILGVSGFFHDSAACLIQDGKLISAVQEEAFSRKKHDARFPIHSINYCLENSGLNWSDIDYIGFYERPDLKFERIHKSISTLPNQKDFNDFLKNSHLDLSSIFPPIKNKGKILAYEHHTSHAASAFYPSPYEEAAIVTLDGVGEFTTTSIGYGHKNKISTLSTISFPHSLGLLYSAFTYYCGFKVNSGEYKLMGLAPFGTPCYTDIIEKHIIKINSTGAYKLNLEYFSFIDPLSTVMINQNFIDLFGMPARKPEEEISKFYMDIAASIQKVFEETVMLIVEYAYKNTGSDNLCLAGGSALNCVSNGKILKDGPFKNVWIQPAAGDAGGAVGVAYNIWYDYLDKERVTNASDQMSGAYLGPEYNKPSIKLYLDSVGAQYKEMDEEAIILKTANALKNGAVIGWFQGRMEFGPRALGNRSILADPRNVEMQKRLNLKTKFRESFRPFAPAIPIEHAKSYFDLECESPYMLFVANITSKHCLNVNETDKNISGFEKLSIKRSTIPAVTHVDYSARVQTISSESNFLFWKLCNEFYKKTDCPVLVNTSFNIRGEPIVCSPEDAFLCFMRSGIDYLVIGNFLLKKEDQKNVLVDGEMPFELD